MDDSESIRQVVGLALRRAGCEVAAACNGQESVMQLDRGKFHLIVSDRNMPVTNGIELEMTSTYQLPTEMTIYAAASIRSTFQEWAQEHGQGEGGIVSAGHSLRVDAAKVMEIDAAGVQLLLALARSVAAKGGRLQLSQASPPVEAACVTFGLVTTLLGGEGQQ